MRNYANVGSYNITSGNRITVCLGLFLGLRLYKSRIGSMVSFLVSLSSKLAHYGYVSTDDKNAIVAVKRVYSVNKYSRISTVP